MFDLPTGSRKATITIGVEGLPVGAGLRLPPIELSLAGNFALEGALAIRLTKVNFDMAKIKLKKLEDVKDAEKEAKALLTGINAALSGKLFGGNPYIQAVIRRDGKESTTPLRPIQVITGNEDEIVKGHAKIPIVIPFPPDLQSPPKMFISTEVEFDYDIRYHVGVAIPTDLKKTVEGLGSSFGSVFQSAARVLAPFAGKKK
jgi:hypothetical protein